MQSGEPELHSFVVKIWLDGEDNEGGAEHRRWRGQITHVPGGERRSVTSLEEILEFISPFLPKASLPLCQRMWRSLRAFRAFWRMLR